MGIDLPSHFFRIIYSQLRLESCPGCDICNHIWEQSIPGFHHTAICLCGDVNAKSFSNPCQCDRRMAIIEAAENFRAFFQGQQISIQPSIIGSSCHGDFLASQGICLDLAYSKCLAEIWDGQLWLVP